MEFFSLTKGRSEIWLENVFDTYRNDFWFPQTQGQVSA